MSLADIGRNCDRELQLKDPKGKVKGVIIFQNFQIVEKPSFVEYLKSGWKINLTVGIDFTWSNLDEHKKADGANMNDYELAIKEVGKILEPYAHDRMLAAFGFGGIPKGETEVSHCFNLNGTDSPIIQGVENLELCYREACKDTKQWGPTLFSPLLKILLKSYVKKNIDKNLYHILLLLTDGQMHDIRSTIDCIVECS